MTVLALIATYATYVVVWSWYAAQLVSVLLGLWALLDAAVRPADHFIAAGRRTKGFWLGVTGAATAVLVLTGNLLDPGAAVGGFGMLGLLGVTAAAVYLTDVRPALNVYRPVRVRSRLRVVRGTPQSRSRRRRDWGRR